MGKDEFICRADQGIEPDDGSNSGLSGCKAGTFKGFSYHIGVICCELHAKRSASGSGSTTR
jgi:hypothetical protein